MTLYLCLYGKGMQAQCESNQQHKNKHRSCRQRTPADCSPKSQCDQPRLCIPFGKWIASIKPSVTRQRLYEPWETGSPTSMLKISSSSFVILSPSSKLFYTLWTATCFLSHELSIYDNILKSSTSRITNVPLGDSDTAWTQASLPAKHRVLASGLQYSLHLLLS